MTPKQTAARLADAIDACFADDLLQQATKLLRQWPEAGWMPIESAPKGRKVLAGYTNSAGKWRTVTARYYPPQTLELDGDDLDMDDDGYAPEGWYEESESQGNILPTDMPPTHWMPLPAAPGAAPSQPAPPAPQAVPQPLTDAVNALLHQIDIGDFVDSNGHSAKMLKAVHDLMRLMADHGITAKGEQ